MSTALHGSTYPMRKMSCFLDKKTIFKCRIDASGNPPPPTSDGTPLNQEFSVSLLFTGGVFFHNAVQRNNNVSDAARWQHAKRPN